MTSRLRRRLFAGCFCAMLSCGADRAAVDGIAPALVSDWGVLRFELAPLWSAALYGWATGALLGGLCADRLGHRTGLAAALLLFGAASMASALSQGIDDLAWWRFVTGLGLGAAVPGAVALLSEHAPDRRRASLITAMLCGLPAGETCSRLLAPWIIADWGWRGFLLWGGAPPLVLALPALLLLPEPERSRAATWKSGVRFVLSKRTLFGSAMLWVAAFMTLVTLHAFAGWLPVLLRNAGLATWSAGLFATSLPLLGIGAILLGRLLDRFNADLILAAGCATMAATVFAIGLAAPAGPLLLVVPASAALIHGLYLSLPALASGFYPPEGRATGVGWMLGLGSLAAVIAPRLVTELMRRNLTFRAIFAFVALPGVIAALALLLKHFAQSGTARERRRQLPG